MPLISVVIPVYNGEKTILQTIESVVNQTLKDIEIIVINDGSTDSTVAVTESISDSRLRVFSYPNGGVSASRNRGISKAIGEFISFIDADDLWTPNKLESQLKALQEHPEAAVAYSWTNFINESGQFLCPCHRVTVTGDVYSKLLVQNFIDSGSNVLIRKAALQTVGGFEESFSLAEDWDMWLRLATRYQFVVVPEVQILYRVSANSLSSNLPRQEAACLKVIERAFSQDEKAQSLQHLKRYSLAQLYKYLIFKLVQVPIEKQQSWVSAKFLWHYVRYDPSMLRQRKFIMTMILKIVSPQLYYCVREIKRLLPRVVAVGLRLD